MNGSTLNNILGTTIGLQSVALLGPNIKLARQSLKPKSKVSIKPIIKTGVANFVGINLLKAQASLI